MTRFLLIVFVACALVPATAHGQGTLSNGGNHEGAISSAGEIDTWRFDANAGDSVTVSIGEVSDPGGLFVPKILLIRPDGSSSVSANNYRAAQFSLRAPVTGTYSVRVSSADAGRAGRGSYVLRLARVPGPFDTPPNDEGGPMTNGANHYGRITLGDLDMWSFSASAGDSLTVSLGEVADNSNGSFVPSITLIRPDGIWGPSANNYRAAQVSLRAPLTGIYTVLVTTADVPRQGVGDYELTLARVPAPSYPSEGDEGGVMTNGANHTGSIHLGDVDIWWFPANAGDSLTVSLGETADDSGGSFVPSIRLVRPDGSAGPGASNYRAAQISHRATLTGTYTVLVTTADVPRQGVGDYVLTLARTPGTFTVPNGDEGGPLTRGPNNRGRIHLGDVDLWTLRANANEVITVSINEVADESQGRFVPSIFLIRPDGSAGPYSTGYTSAQVTYKAPVAGTYTILVTTTDVPREGVGTYTLTSSHAGALLSSVAPGDSFSSGEGGFSYFDMATIVSGFGTSGPSSLPSGGSERPAVRLRGREFLD